MLFDQRTIHAKQVTRPSGQFRFRQISMSIHRCLKQCIQNTTAHAEIRIRADTYPCRNLIRDTEAHSVNVIRQFIRIFFYDPVNLLPIGLIDLHRK